ncbi:hypothetical protein V6N12_035398 [Hibiscus sabdariffa]|uniref:Uncharacterized protein n=1 Tax=Hibiscus sabdariffa TaxID=183260 RepID=A0ABR2EMN0_9ROSI
MVFSLSWRRLRWWCVYYAWCMLRALLGLPCGRVPSEAALALCGWLLAHQVRAALLISVSGSPLTLPNAQPALASPVRFLSPFVVQGLGHPWRSLSTLRSPWLGMALSVRGLFLASVALHAWCTGPLGYTDYGCAGRCPGCCFGPLVCTIYGRLGRGPGCCLGTPTIPLPVVLVHGCTLAQPSWQALGCARIVAHRAAPKVLCCRGQDACSLDWLRALLRPFRGLCVTLWHGVQVTLGPVTLGHCLVPQASSVWTL